MASPPAVAKASPPAVVKASPSAKAPPAPKPSACRKCMALFPSRNALFEHLRRTYPGQQKAPAATVLTPAIDDNFGNPSPTAELSTPLVTAFTPALAVIEAVYATVLAAVVRRLATSPAAASIPEQHLLPAGYVSPQRYLLPAGKTSPQRYLQVAGKLSPQQYLLPAGYTSPQQHLLPAGNSSPPAVIFKPGRDVIRLQRCFLSAGKPSSQRCFPFDDAFGKPPPPPQRCPQPTRAASLTRRPHAP
ncbi:zinc finger domain-containing protein [Ophiocordyceps sinensis CO18]|uniref:Zinc finger domain-containing protein n=1 Tax=Ophiocordyceps sinensis (strain Co18 / CGMCC 3.14243) TaxID=911162 RepID=T5AEA4_OPHSC|nr:zinc finger domain-containing protein [Ophiocordyceps sinensis CO18]